MAIQRENILKMIGGRRYHSAILTTFSFDFCFFEMKAMKWLRSCGVRNVNVLIDGHYYAELMQQVIGEEMRLTPGYSLYPVFHTSIFHPKIWLLVGEKEGLLIIGSGNLTSSGNGNNDEIWGAFHFDIRSAENAALFATAWHYIQRICNTTKGLIKEKTSRWITDHAKWLNGLPRFNSYEFLEIAGNEKIAFLANIGKDSIWTQMEALIKEETIVEITTVSPYYDRNGGALQSLRALYPKATINVVIDESGAVPFEIPSPDYFRFYHWSTSGVSAGSRLKSNISEQYSKLHAKIIHFISQSGREYCLFGSANVTIPGLGLPGSVPNYEVSLLMQSDSGGILHQLGLKLTNPVSLQEFNSSNTASIFETVINRNKSSIWLLSVEWVLDELFFYAEGVHNEPVTAKLFNSEHHLLHEIPLGNFQNEMKSKVTMELNKVHHIQLFNAENNTPVSNAILLANYTLLVKTHPNPGMADIERLYGEIHNGELGKVLDLLRYAIEDETESNDWANKGSGGGASSVQSAPDMLFDLSSYEYTDNKSREKALIFSSLTLRVLDVLKFIRSPEFSKKTNDHYYSTDHELDLDAQDGTGSAPPAYTYLKLDDLKLQRKKLINYFKKLNDNQWHLIYGKNKPGQYLPTLTDLIKYLVALELMFEFGGKSEKYTENGHEYFFSYLPHNGEVPYFNDNLKGCSLNIIGDFLVLARTGFKTYEFEYTVKKLEHLKFEALVNSIVCVLNTKWKAEELPYFFTLLLNTLHYLGGKDYELNVAPLMDAITTRISELKNLHPTVYSNLSEFEKTIFPVFVNTLNQIKNKIFETQASKGQIIYKSPWGYCWVKNVTPRNEFTLVRPGFVWDGTLQEFTGHVYSDKHQPLEISQFVRVMP